MKPYRAQEPRPDDLETAAILDLLTRIKALRKRVALPVMVIGLTVPWLGMAAHATGHWSVLGVLHDGTYFVSTFTFLVAAVICGAPIVVPGAAVYYTMRLGVRREWHDEHLAKGVSEEWLEENVGRFG